MELKDQQEAALQAFYDTMGTRDPEAATKRLHALLAAQEASFIAGLRAFRAMTFSPLWLGKTEDDRIGLFYHGQKPDPYALPAFVVSLEEYVTVPAVQMKALSDSLERAEAALVMAGYVDNAGKWELVAANLPTLQNAKAAMLTVRDLLGIPALHSLIERHSSTGKFVDVDESAYGAFMADAKATLTAAAKGE